MNKRGGIVHGTPNKNSKAHIFKITIIINSCYIEDFAETFIFELRMIVYGNSNV